MVLEWERYLLDALGDVLRHIPKTPLVHFRRNVDAARGTLAPDDASGRHDADVCDLNQRNLRPALAVDHQVPHIIDVAAHLWAAPDHHVEDFLLLEQRTDGNAADDRRGGPADVARFQAVAGRAIDIHLDLDRWLFDLQLHLRIFNAGDLRHQRADLLRLGANDVEAIAIDAHGDGIRVAGERLTQLSRQVCVNPAAHAGIGGHGFLHGIDRCFVVGLRIDVDPHLPRVHVRRAFAVTKQGPSEVSGGVPHTGDLPQFANQAHGGSGHRRQRGAWRALPFDDQIGLVEAGQHLGFELAPDRDAGDRRRDADTDASDRGAG